MTGTAIAGSRLDVDTEELAADCLAESAVSASGKAFTLKETTYDAAMGRCWLLHKNAQQQVFLAACLATSIYA